MSHLRRSLLATTTVTLAVASTLLAPTVAAAADPYDVRIRVLDPAGHAVPAGVDVVEYTGQVSGRTNADGRVVFHAVQVPADRFYFCARLESATQHLAGPTGWAAACGTATPVNGVAVATVRFSIGAAIGGTVTDLRTGRPIAGQQVYGNFSPLGVSDASGHWTLPNYPSGTSTEPVQTQIQADLPDAPHGYARTTVAAPGVALQAGRTTETGTDVLAPRVEFRGTVLDADNRPVGADVTVWDVDGNPSTPPVAGSAQLAVPGAGRYSVFASWTATPKRQVCASTSVVPDHPEGLALTCSPSNDPSLTITRTITLPDGGVVTGRLTRNGLTDFRVVIRVRSGGEDIELPAQLAGNSYTAYGVPAGVRTVVVIPGDAHYVAQSSPRVTVTANAVTTAPRITIARVS